MKTQTVYLKTTREKFYTAFIGFNSEHLTYADVSNESINYGKFDDLDELKEAIGRYLTDGYEICTREEFQTECIRVTKEYNQIVKEL